MFKIYNYLVIKNLYALKSEILASSVIYKHSSFIWYQIFNIAEIAN